jgi:DNA-binding response OmpR family regulator
MNVSILWVDDEIDLLKAHIIYLQQKGYTVITATNGNDAIDLVTSERFDLVLLDENMPGLTGLQTLSRIKELRSSLPVVMITKSEEENIMDQAVGAKIDDYLIKPVNPNQILLSIKKHVHNRRLVSEKTTADYRTAFGDIGALISMARSINDWITIYKRLTQWRLQLAEATDQGMAEVFSHQMLEANNAFGKFIKNRYADWMKPTSEDKPHMSHGILRSLVFPAVDVGKPVLLLVMDNLRFDQWKIIEALLSPYWRVDRELLYCSILPTATQYARNALFSGLMPAEIYKLHPDFWVFDEEDDGKNLFEEELLVRQLQRLGKKYRFHYEKGSTLKGKSNLWSNPKKLLENQLNVIVYNFIDIISHARTEMEMMRQLASDEAAYLSLTSSWFRHSDLFAFLKEASNLDVRLIITTDHGTVRVQNPVKVVGDRATSTNLRYKLGKNLNYNPKEVFEVRRPEDIHLPKPNVSSSYIFALGNDFLAYPNNYNHYVKYYRDTFQHGGVSLEEMLIPYIELSSAKTL